ncbi:hypothetical protein CS022_13375 [Veronia nyctiphanis]|uniref:VOC domain-containing protein n=1 Tax=Veronia nyctiphanis TaxID=1278244 RepID=A0A4Q0YPA2_9GAMM|nr:hypothetical protein [Veronia nyctiphanis]RXJ72840.1 hypothetical protein CS022_13375 [Veronia nyctiphanis]
MIKYLEVHVDDIEKSRIFWSWFLDEVGYCPNAQWDKGFSYNLGECYLSFVQAANLESPEVFHPTLKDLKHIPFGASSANDVELMAQALTSRGVALNKLQQPDESALHAEHCLWFTDLNGLSVEYSTAA